MLFIAAHIFHGADFLAIRETKIMFYRGEQTEDLVVTQYTLHITTLHVQYFITEQLYRCNEARRFAH